MKKIRLVFRSVIDHPLKRRKMFVLLFVFLCICVVGILGSSYAWFVKTDVVKDFQIVVGELTYILKSNSLNSNNQVTVSSGEAAAFDILVTSDNLVDTKYQMVYSSSDDLTDVEVGYDLETVDTPSGTIEKNGTKTISVVIKNQSTSSVVIEFNVRGGLKNNEVSDIVILSGDLKLDVGISFEKTTMEMLFLTENLGDNCTTYNDGIDTFLVGQCSQNYVWYSGKLWRAVLKNNETGAVKLVTDNAITAIPYNGDGNITFKDSYLDQWLNQEFLPTLHDYSNYLVTDYSWDVTEDSTDEPTRPSGTTVVSRTVGLLNGYEYYTTYAESSELASYSTGYLNSSIYWWLLTPYSSNRVRYVRTTGTMLYSNVTYGYGVRPAVNFKSTVQIDSGSGIKSNPYILMGEEKVTSGTTLLSTRYSGEYVTFNNELYRIVGVEEGLTKVTAVDKTATLTNNVFDSSDSETTNFANASIKTDLESYYQNLNTTWKNMIEPNTTWYLGIVGDETNGNYHYKASICASIDANVSTLECSKTTSSVTANIALPRAGEMFTSQITRGTKDYFWTLTSYSSSDVWNVDSTGDLYSDSPTSEYGARPSMYLKSTVKIASDNTGNGTYEKPYSLSLN